MCVCACVRVFTDAELISSVRCCCKEVHKHLYRFYKTVVTEEEPFLFTQIQNKETSLKLPVIDMWACFSSHDWKK